MLVRSTAVLTLFLAASARLWAEGATPRIHYTGAPTDGGRDCSTCHNSFAPNSDTSGSVTMDVTQYNPNVTQVIHVIVRHPTATRWGFQMTARPVTDETQPAGAFTSDAPNVQVRCDDGSQLGAVAPCGVVSQREFVEHSDAPRTSNGAGFEFDLMWMPPSPEVGKVTFYLSAVAADGDQTPAGDRVYTISRTIDFTGACPDSKRPTLRTAESAASITPPFSSRSLIAILGLGFTDAGTKRTAGLGDFSNGAYPTVLSCAAVEVSGPGLATPVRLPITYIQQDQINAQAPTFIGTGPVTMTVVLNPGKPNEIRSDPITLNSLQPLAPAFLTLDASGTGSILARFALSSQVVAPPGLIPGAMPAKPGDLLSLYGTGFGDTNPLFQAGQLTFGQSPLTNPFTVTVGGMQLPQGAMGVLYGGLTGGAISGLYQFNIRLPDGLGSGDVPVVISIGGVQTQAGITIPIQ